MKEEIAIIIEQLRLHWDNKSSFKYSEIPTEMLEEAKQVVVDYYLNSPTIVIKDVNLAGKEEASFSYRSVKKKDEEREQAELFHSLEGGIAYIPVQPGSLVSNLVFTTMLFVVKTLNDDFNGVFPQVLNVEETPKFIMDVNDPEDKNKEISAELARFVIAETIRGAITEVIDGHISRENALEA